MAQTTGPGSRTNGDTSASNGANGATGDGGARRGFSLSGLFAPRQASGANGTTTRSQRPSTGMGSFLKGWLLLVVGMYVLQILLYVVDANLFHGWLETHYLAGTHGGTKPGSAFIVGGMSWYLLIFVALFAGLYYALVKLNVLPKDLFGQRSQANARAARDGRDTGTTSRAGTGTATRTSPAPLPSGVNPYANRTRAARRETQRRLALAAATPQPKRGLFGRSKPAVPTATATAAAVTTKNPTRVAESATVASAANAGDSHYQRVRAEQRQRKRRAAKR